MIADERQRQISVEGYKPEDDIEGNRDRQLARGAQAYLAQYVARSWILDVSDRDGGNLYQNEEAPDCWPDDWDLTWWKPKGKIEDLVRAGALIAAELDRLLATK